MKLLQINTVGNWGSTGRIAEEIGKVAQTYGWESYIACARNIRESSSEIIRIGSSLGIYFNVIWNRIFDCDSPISKIATKKLISKIKEISPDVIHLHNTHGYYIHNYTLLKFLVEYNRPVVWTLHDCWVLTGHCCYFEQIKCERWKTRCGDCPLKRDYPRSYVFDNSRKNHIKKTHFITNIKKLTFITCSQWLANLVQQSNLKKINTIVINNGIDIDTFKPVSIDLSAKFGYYKNKKTILSVASVWTKEKGFYHLLQIRKILDDKYQMIVVGVSEKQKILLNQHGIIGIPRTENIEELVALYSFADIFINPTLIDNYPTVNLESIACGTPVITYDSGGAKETIINENVGSVIQQGDMDALLESIEKFSYADPLLTQKNCREVAEKYFNKENIWEKYTSLYEELLSRK